MDDHPESKPNDYNLIIPIEYRLPPNKTNNQHPITHSILIDKMFKDELYHSNNPISKRWR